MEVTTSATEDVISAYLRRTKDGLRVDVKVHPDVEHYFNNLSHGQHENVRAYGKNWAPIDKVDGSQGEALRVWVFNWPQGHEDFLNPGTMHQPGGTPRLENGRVNISFLRLVGASRPEGVSFIWNAMLGDEELRRLASQFHRAQERFYTEFVKPTEVEIAVERRV